jgi:hypothetical protein
MEKYVVLRMVLLELVARQSGQEPGTFGPLTVTGQVNWARAEGQVARSSSSSSHGASRLMRLGRAAGPLVLGRRGPCRMLLPVDHTLGQWPSCTMQIRAR